MRDRVKDFAKNGYDDKQERLAFRRMVRTDPALRNFLIDYCSLDIKNAPYNEVNDPLGMYGVDLGVVDKNDNIVCLVEVDVFFTWKDEWPHYYKWCHRLGRKEKYYADNDYPYINITFNANHKNGILTTREIESQYPIKEKWFKHKQMNEMVREIPISEAIKIGEWA